MIVLFCLRTFLSIITATLQKVLMSFKLLYLTFLKHLGFLGLPIISKGNFSVPSILVPINRVTLSSAAMIFKS